MIRVLMLATASLLLLPAITLAQEIREEQVHFAPGSTGTVIDGAIRGYEIIDYVLGAATGQQMSVKMETSNPSSYFNVMIRADEQAIHVGSIDGNEWTGTLPETDDYRIRVYLMRNAARRDETADYSLSINIAARDPGFADGLSAGPDYWETTNVPANDTLNVRSGPGTDNEIVGELANGDIARNLGCEMQGQSRWCLIEAGVEMKFTGWVNGRYLMEASTYPTTPDREATGRMPCSTAAGQPTGQCDFRVSRGANGNASVWVALPQGGERYIEFRNGEPVTSEAGLDVTFEKSNDLYLIRIGGVERYEIPQAVVYGG
jgi:hypothetical protein